MTRRGIDPAGVLAETAWLRALARSLVSGEDRADDLCQDALIATLRRNRPIACGVRPFLVRVAKNLARRTWARDNLRARREREAATPGVEPAAAEVVERFQVQRHVCAAVDALPEPYRTTVLLRFFDDLPPREIARNLQLPVETVRTRLKRALALLRTRLDAEYGSRMGWVAPLGAGPGLAGAVGEATVVSPLLLWGIVMGAKAKLLVAAGLSVTALLVLRSFAADSGEPLADERGSHAAPAASAARVGPAPAMGVTSQRTAVEPASRADASVALLVRAIYDEDGTPAANVGVAVEQDDGPPLGRIVFTAADGTARFAPLCAGRAEVSLYRRDVYHALELVAGPPRDLEVRIPRGIDVAGIVVDAAGAAVAGAEVLVTEGCCYPQRTFSLARSAGDGTFSLRSLGGGQVVGARTAEHGSSDFVLVESAQRDPKAPARLRLVLPCVAGAIRGQVTDRAGHALAEALVSVGRVEATNLHPAEDGDAQTPPAQHLVTDSGGRFGASGVNAGAVPVRVWRRGFAPQQRSIELARGQQTELQIVLDAGATLEGKVVDGEGNPVAGASVVTQGLEYPPRTHAETDALGAYRIPDLPAGELSVLVEGGEKGSCEQRLPLRTGEVTRWDCKLLPSFALRGVVLDHTLRPLAGWMVTSINFRGAQTDERGEFSIARCEDRDYELLVSPGRGFAPPACVVEARPGVPLRIVVPEEARRLGSIRGALVVGECSLPALLSLSIRRGGWHVDVPQHYEAASGRFRVDGLPPGSYEIQILERDQATIRRSVKLRPAEDLDLGELRFPAGGSLIAKVTGVAAVPGESYFVLREGGGIEGQARVAGGDLCAGPLVPGRYELCVFAKDLVATLVPFEIRAREVTRTSLELRRGAECVVRIGRDRRKAPAIVDMTVAREGEPPCFRCREGQCNDNPPRPNELRIGLLPGRYVVLASIAGDVVTRGRFTVVGAGGIQEFSFE